MEYPFVEIQEKLRIGRMYTFFMPTYDDTYTFSGESHNFWETLYVLSGSVCVSANENIYNLNAGDIVFHEPFEVHKFHATSKDTKLLIFSYDLEGNFSDYFKNKVFTLTKHQKSIIASLVSFVNEAVDLPVQDYNTPENVTQEGWMYYLTPVNNNPSYGQEIVSYLYQLMLNLYNNGKMAHPSKTYETVLFSKVVKFMIENLSEELSVPDIARHMAVSTSGLKRVFLKCAGMGVHKYFLTLKLNAATELLENGQSVSDVSFRLGFSSSSYFSKVYKRELGIAPSGVKRKF